eukprot:TRINITY_DN8215_c0_g1_i1.p1 TRINITY_DN8215_c0_g1~~TRINITY_DN8215_c0_g1_i1.p1  ORF type:complete len:589 (+),score=189.39 TRINITY_DN8215_c0_g1_i1:35-1768(+)
MAHGMKRRSHIITGSAEDEASWVNRCGARAQLRAAGYEDADFAKPVVTVAAPYMSLNMCNQRTAELAGLVGRVFEENGIKANVSMTPVVSDGQTMGTSGMRMSLISRDVIADCIEVMASGYLTDGIFTFGGCDKANPGGVIPLARLNVPGITLYPGTGHSGIHPKTGARLTPGHAYEVTGAVASGLADMEELDAVEKHACPGSGTCSGMFTANTMSTCIEAMGMALPGTSTVPAISQADGGVHPEVLANCRRSAAALRVLMEKNIRPRDIITLEAMENAIVVMMALGGSTNAVMHLLAIAREAGVALSLADFNRIAAKVPFLARLTPAGPYNVVDLHAIGGLPVVMKHLLDHGLLHGACLTVTGRTVAENLADVPPLPTDQDVVLPLAAPAAPPMRHIVVLFGTLAPDGAVIKTSGKAIGRWEGPARVCDSEADALEVVKTGQLKKGEALVIRYEGPAGGPGMPEMLAPGAAMIGAALGPHCPLITDGRFSGASHGIMIGHAVPEAARGGPIALVRDGDRIVIDVEKHVLDLDVPADVLLRRKAAWGPPPPKAGSRGILNRYAQTVTDASQGCVSKY